MLVVAHHGWTESINDAQHADMDRLGIRLSAPAARRVRPWRSTLSAVRASAAAAVGSVVGSRSLFLSAAGAMVSVPHSGPQPTEAPPALSPAGGGDPALMPGALCPPRALDGGDGVPLSLAGRLREVEDDYDYDAADAVVAATGASVDGGGALPRDPRAAKPRQVVPLLLLISLQNKLNEQPPRREEVPLLLRVPLEESYRHVRCTEVRNFPVRGSECRGLCAATAVQWCIYWFEVVFIWTLTH